MNDSFPDEFEQVQGLFRALLHKGRKNVCVCVCVCVCVLYTVCVTPTCSSQYDAGTSAASRVS